MRTKTLGLLLALSSFFMISNLQAQDYNTAVGLRFGSTTGLTIKHNYKPNSAVEGIIGFFGNGFSLTGLIERHPQAFDVRGLHWYYGAGAHIAFYRDPNDFNSGFNRDIKDRDNDDIGIGIDGIVGLEYKFPDGVPLAVSMGLKPFIEVDTEGDVGALIDPGLGLKITF